MNSRMVVLEPIAVLAGAVIGTLVAGFAERLFAGVPLATTIGTVGPYVLALVTVAIFAALYHRLAATPAVLASLAVGIVLPSLVDRFAFGQTLGWPSLLLFNLVFAVAALAAYRFVHANARARDLSRRTADRLP